MTAAPPADPCSETPQPFCATRRVSALEEDEFYPNSLQEELNEIMAAFYAAVSEEDILSYQGFVEDITKRKIAEGAVQSPSKAPDFELEDQDGDLVSLSELLKSGPVVLVFYRGKWCPHCNATIMRMADAYDRIKEAGATLVALSPMLPDGTQFLASKRCLQFSVCSDIGNEVAKQYGITFEVSPEFRERMVGWGEDVPLHNGDDTWEIPLPATYIIDQNRDIVWSFIDNDPGCRAEPDDIVAAIPRKDGESNPASTAADDLLQLPSQPEDDGSPPPTRKKRERRISPMNILNPSSKRTNLTSTFKRSMKKVFGKKNQPPPEFLGNYLLPPS